MILNVCLKIRNAPTHITLRTSIIVGFPGETDEQFGELCDFVKEIKFDNSRRIASSQEEGIFTNWCS